MNLDIKLYTDRTCAFEAYDNTDFLKIDDISNLSKYVFVEFITNIPFSPNIEITPVRNSVKLTSFINDEIDNRYRYSFQNDGRKIYHKFGIFTLEHPRIFKNGVYEITNLIFYHNGNFYKGLKNMTSLNITPENSRQIFNLNELNDFVLTGIDLFYTYEFFTICNLEKCLVNLQKEYIFNGLQNCDLNKCDNRTNLKLQRDFLFISVNLLKYLIEIEDYLEAQRIIEALTTCSNLCANININSNCGC